MSVDILDLLLDDDYAPKAEPKPIAKVDDSEADLDLLLEEFSTGDTETKKASLKAILAMIKK